MKLQNHQNKVAHRVAHGVAHGPGFRFFPHPKNKVNKPLKMTDDDERHFQQGKVCHICGKKYFVEDKRIRDLCHITGKYHGSAHEVHAASLILKERIGSVFTSETLYRFGILVALATYNFMCAAVKNVCKCNLFTHGTPGVHKNSFEMPMHSRIVLEFGNVGFGREGKTGVPGEKPLRAE